MVEEEIHFHLVSIFKMLDSLEWKGINIFHSVYKNIVTMHVMRILCTVNLICCIFVYCRPLIY